MALAKQFTFLFVVTLVAMGMSSVSARSASLLRTQELCSEPADLHERLQELYRGRAQSDMHETFYMLPFLREAAINQTRRYNFSLDNMKRSKVFSGSRKCHKHDSKQTQALEPCPVYHTLNTDNTRLPRILLEAQCRCGHCRGIDQRIVNGSLVIPKCEGVFYYHRVLRRLPDCADGMYQYAPVWEKLQVGCSCRLVHIPTVTSTPENRPIA